MAKTLLARSMPGPGKDIAQVGAFGAALVWALHPLASLPVLYVIQRAEILAALFYLLSILFHMRGAGSARKNFWDMASLTALCLGAVSKEIIATSPVAIILFDRAFVHGSLKECWKRERSYYLGFLIPIGLLAALMAASSGRGSTAGFSVPIAWHEYLRTQFYAIFTYMKLALFPVGLTFDYGGLLKLEGFTVLPYAFVVLALLGLASWGVARNNRAAVVGFCFFLILAPTSSVVPISETIAEHRAYLPLAALAGLAAWGICSLARRVFGGKEATRKRLAATAGLVLVALAVALGTATTSRIGDFSNEIAIWSDTVGKRPASARARAALAGAVAEAGDLHAAADGYADALRIEPNFVDALAPYSFVLLKLGRVDEALGLARRAVAARPGWDWGYLVLGAALMERGAVEEGIESLLQAVKMNPGFSEA